MRSLTHSKEHYIKTLYVLDVDGKGVTVSELADALGVSRASACVALRELEKAGCVDRTPTRRATLNMLGMALAVEIETAYLTSVRYFTELLGFPPEKAREAACALEHVLGEGEWYRMDAALPALP